MRKLMVTRRLFIAATLERVANTVTNLEVDVRTRRLTGHTDIADDLPFGYMLTYRHRDTRLMRVEGLSTVAVLNNDVLAVARIPSTRFGNHNVAFGSCANRCADRRGKVNPVIPVNSLRLHSALDRPQIVAGLRHRTLRSAARNRTGNGPDRCGGDLSLGGSGEHTSELQSQFHLVCP